ncbi:hypothetical protein ACFE04_029178 [Oxalis oulophora]
MTVKVNIFVLCLVVFLTSTVKSADFDIMKYGAKADKNIDMSKALLAAWKEACNCTEPGTVVIPKGDYLLNEVKLEGPCNAPITIKLAGTLFAHPDAKNFPSGVWLTINYVNQLMITGGGTLDGQGATAWKESSCNKNANCPRLPMNLGFNFVNNSVIQEITTKDSKNFHVNVLGCSNVTFQRFTVSAPENSTNTDGIHMGKSTGINVVDTTIGTGDDCISIGDGIKNVTIKGVKCGPGHGISVGSLGRYKNEEPVSGLTVSNCTITGTTNGVRIKSWPAMEAGDVSDIHFEDIVMCNVSNPIIVDQYYCPWNQCNKQKPSLVKISNVSFKKIRGTSATQNVIKLSCSSGNPCNGVEVADISLTYSGPEGPALSTCNNVKPSASGKIEPALCSAPAPL